MNPTPWTRPLILASASPRRRALLARLNLPFRVEVSEVEERASGHLTPREICLANASAKAWRVARRFPDALVLGADTEVTLGSTVFGKPRDLAEAEAFLARLSGQTHHVITGVTLVCVGARFHRSFAEVTGVTFHPLTTEHIRDYLRQVNPLDKAGAYAAQESGEALIEAVHGSLTNVVGLPLGRLRTELDKVPDRVRRAGAV